jgi:hypothetical protein
MFRKRVESTIEKKEKGERRRETLAIIPTLHPLHQKPSTLLASPFVSAL